MTNRRQFILQTAGELGVMMPLSARVVAGRIQAQVRVRTWLESELASRGPLPAPEQLAEDEPFWARVREAYDLNPDVVNLDHGWTNPAPRTAVDELARQARALEALPAEELNRLFFEGASRNTIREALAQTMGVPAQEIALVRNATEALDTVLLGVPLRSGDEIVCSAHDYFAMLDALEQRQARAGVVLRMVRPPVPAPSLDALAEMYQAAIGSRTKLVLLTHPSNLTGQLLPVRRIAAAAHRVGAEVVVDGAQSLGVLEEPVQALGCDYYGASAHKWLGCPVGLGVLWMRPQHVQKIWPLVPPPPGIEGMTRFEWPGTTPAFIEPSILPALELHRSLGPGRKAARIRYLTAYWRNRVAKALPEARFYSTADPAMSLGLCTVEFPGDPQVLQRRLRERHGILVQAMSNGTRRPEIRGLRVTPNVYSTPAELDRFVAALQRTLGEGR